MKPRDGEAAPAQRMLERDDERVQQQRYEPCDHEQEQHPAQPADQLRAEVHEHDHGNGRQDCPQRDVSRLGRVP